MDEIVEGGWVEFTRIPGIWDIWGPLISGDTAKVRKVILDKDGKVVAFVFKPLFRFPKITPASNARPIEPQIMSKSHGAVVAAVTCILVFVGLPVWSMSGFRLPRIHIPQHVEEHVTRLLNDPAVHDAITRLIQFGCGLVAFVASWLSVKSVGSGVAKMGDRHRNIRKDKQFAAQKEFETRLRNEAEGRTAEAKRFEECLKAAMSALTPQPRDTPLPSVPLRTTSTYFPKQWDIVRVTTMAGNGGFQVYGRPGQVGDICTIINPPTSSGSVDVLCGSRVLTSTLELIYRPGGTLTT